MKKLLSVLFAGAFGVVTGTVTVRVNGVPTKVQRIDYLFAPAFQGNAGEPVGIGDGNYFLRAERIPLDKQVKLGVTAVYDDTERGADGSVLRQGRTYFGTLRIDVPYAADGYDFGWRFLDLR